MLMNLYRTVASVLCLTTLSLVGCSDDGGDDAAAAIVTATDGQVQTASLEASPGLVADASTTADDVKSSDTKTPTSQPARYTDIGPRTAPRNQGGGLSRRKGGPDLSAGPGSRGDLSIPTASTITEDYIVIAEPASLELGEVGTGEKAKGSFKLVNTGDKPMTIIQCKANCGCTVPKCPTNTELAPGASYVVEVVMTAGAKGGIRQSKRVDIIVDGQPLLRVPISADVVAYVEVSPRIIGPDVNSDGRFVIRSLDNTPFRVLSMTPPLIEDGIDADPESEAKLEHVLYMPWDNWKDKGSPRQLSFQTDHPKVKQLKVSVRVVRPNINPSGRNSRAAIATINPDNAIAARAGNVEKILAVTKTKEDLELIDTTGATLLGIAANAGQTEVVKVLLEAKANPNALDKRGRTPLLATIQKRDTNLETIKALIAGGADVNTRDRGAGASVLGWAAGPLGSVEKVKVLLEAGSSVNAVDARGDTPLMWAARFGNADTIKALLNAGADASIANKKGDTALQYATKRRASEAVISEIAGLLKQSLATQE